MLLLKLFWIYQASITWSPVQVEITIYIYFYVQYDRKLIFTHSYMYDVLKGTKNFNALSEITFFIFNKKLHQLLDSFNRFASHWNLYSWSFSWTETLFNPASNLVKKEFNWHLFCRHSGKYEWKFQKLSGSRRNPWSDGDYWIIEGCKKNESEKGFPLSRSHRRNQLAKFQYIADILFEVKLL